MKTRITATLGVAALSIAALAGCSSGGGQTTEEACAIVETDMTAASESLATLNPSDLESLTTATEGFVKAMDDTDAKITNKEVKEAFGGVKTVFDAAFKEVSLDNVDKLANLGTDIQSAGEKLAAVCPGSSTGF